MAHIITYHARTYGTINSNGAKLVAKEDGDDTVKYPDFDGCDNDQRDYGAPTINTDAFPNTLSDYYWTASAFADDDNDNYAWGVVFHPLAGFTFGTRKAVDGYVRLVRSGLVLSGQ